MTSAQIFRWFCKEQKVMHMIQKIYYEIHPYQITHDNLNHDIIRKFINFDKYIEDKINDFGFYKLLLRILDDYSSEMRRRIPFVEFCEWRKKFMEDNAKLLKKWDYFANNNITLADMNLIIGKNFIYRNWGEYKHLTVTSIDVPNGIVHGIVKFINIGYPTSVRICNLIGENDKKVKINFSIKRNRKVYHGKN